MAGRTHPERDPTWKNTHHHAIRNDGQRFDTAAELLRSRQTKNAALPVQPPKSTKGIKSNRKDSDVPSGDRSHDSSEANQSSATEDPPNTVPPKDSEGDGMGSKQKGAPKLLKSMPGPTWNQNSCWIDSSLQLLYMAIVRDFHTFESRFSGLKEDSIMHQLYQQINTRRLLYADTKVTREHSISRLQETRDEFRKLLSRKKLLMGEGSFTFQPVFVSILSYQEIDSMALDMVRWISDTQYSSD
jgi:hypothetical protein